MKFSILCRALILMCAGLLLAARALAGGSLISDQSVIYFVSVKNAAVAEVHHFGRLSGGITDDGLVTVEIVLDGVETLIPIRNERMREMLFETASFPSAILSTSIDTSRLDGLAKGQQIQMQITLNVELHGVSKDLQTAVTITRLDQGIEVTTSAPLVINAADFDLVAGLGKLQVVAGLNSISSSVPVTARLVFAH